MITTPDFLNSCLEAAMGIFGYQSLRAIRRDKTVKGVHWGPTFVATCWGFYNLFYYPYLHQFLSFFAGMGIVSINSAWLWFAYKYGAFTKATPKPQPFNPISTVKQ